MPLQVENSKAKKVAVLAILLAIALILSYVESLVMISSIIPGVKLGLSNIALVVVLYKFDDITTLSFGIMKSLLSLFFLGRLASLLFSIIGVLLAVLIMIIIKKIPLFSLFSVCVSGSVFHVWGQLIAACLLISNTAPLRFIPMFTVLAVVSGAVLYLPIKSLLKVLKF